MTELKSKVALVTGAGRGIGRSVALELARQGLQVVLVARNEAEIEAVAGEIKASGGSALAIPFNLGELEKIEGLVNEINSQLGRLCQFWIRS